MSTPGSATAADVPGKYDLVINGFGYCLLDSLESSIPFRTHRAIYGQTQPFVERQNVSNSYGDNAQDFFLTVRQRDWSLGEQQKYFRAGQDGRYWSGTNVDITVPGQVTLAESMPSVTFANAVITGTRDTSQASALVASATNLYRLAVTGAITDLGAHGLGAAPTKFSVVCDGALMYLTTTASGTVGIRSWNNVAFATFSATGADSLAFVNNTLYGWSNVASDLLRYDTAGTPTELFQWKTATGAVSEANTNIYTPMMCSFGGKLLICFPFAQEASELWIYDGVGVSRLEVFPPNFVATDIEVLYGVAYIAGNFYKAVTTSTWRLKPAVMFYDGSQIGMLWQANSYTASSASTGVTTEAGPCLGVAEGRLLFTDDTMATVMAYNPATGGVSTIGSYTAGGSKAVMVTSNSLTANIRNQTTGYYFPHVSTYNTSGTVISSLIDFDSSLPKQFRGIKVEWDAASDGDGGSVDIAYQVDSLTGSWTTLKTGAVSGIEYPGDSSNFAAGHSIAVKLTINKGTSTAGPTLRSLSVRGAPEMPIYPRGEYIIDCTADQENPRELRDGSYSPLTGWDQVQNLLAARNSAAPVSITDKINGTYTGYVDVNDPEGFDVYEEHPDPSNPEKAGSYVVRLTTRGV